ncbi:DM13 domain-containing protein [Streptomyces caniscabiei]|uniref:DM13 domain-containing protein n=1 Tax=Streptomyces caniscabiei TaxID=2746961 RepID=A0A927QK14_9ACTN|nr:DM13 domain-containing protein [Streptomyces caniscabiei]MBD9701765.1 DM13 domain-containing protein [Streptomyces caniscabiei]MBD9724497.1 DM13 domain-containing protein [Streptomyces caniscabiei]MDX3507909.1 DM13 domain-containing protein [Streptomyces caniscabiei]MDX3717871.1 DM13 domain-containing protein [Streptomyces caniscabiei]MDX3726461.1 DM13 domain-containing protein [Streptomyces caniscabiei]
MGRLRRTLTKPVVIAILVVGVVVAGLGLYWFQPWKLWTDETVRETLPSATATVTAPASATASPTAAETQTVARGEFLSHEHATSGDVRLLRLADGSYVVRLEDFDTSNGPDLRVWLSDAPVKEGKDGWHLFDDDAYDHVSLGGLKGNKGDQNYRVPGGVDPGDFGSVTIWCDRFNVSFGAAELVRGR